MCGVTWKMHQLDNNKKKKSRSRRECKTYRLTAKTVIAVTKPHGSVKNSHKIIVHGESTTSQTTLKEDPPTLKKKRKKTLIASNGFTGCFRGVTAAGYKPEPHNEMYQFKKLS